MGCIIAHIFSLFNNLINCITEKVSLLDSGQNIFHQPQYGKIYIILKLNPWPVQISQSKSSHELFIITILY